ncbi:MAG: hypothetical protein IT258_11045 [Saprospiraceae bacterium]|nr:hypothetical protein [Saprospiraceae bacterium]
MKNIFLFCFATLVFIACKEKNEETPVLDPCLETQFEEFKAAESAVSILKQEVNGKTHYWLHSNVIEVWAGGMEIIINEDCEDVCHICGTCAQTQCPEVYDPEAWEVVWEK